MQVNVQKLSPVLVEFDVEIESGRVQDELNKAYTALSKSARIKGFRKGKAPRQVLQRMFGPRVAADVAQKLVDESFPKVVSEQQVQPVNNPAIEPAELKQGAPFSYKARFEVVPEIESVE
ncbi:MAG: trigger factor family protein [Myxococcales bacterium]|nr:trigger factor family protein [Myxococcales bacterium]